MLAQQFKTITPEAFVLLYPVMHIAERLCLKLVVMFASNFFLNYQASFCQDTQVLRDRWSRHGELLRQNFDGLASSSDQVKQAAPGWVRDGVKYVALLGFFFSFHVLVYVRICLLVKGKNMLTVVVPCIVKTDVPLITARVALPRIEGMHIPKYEIIAEMIAL